MGLKILSRAADKKSMSRNTKEVIGFLAPIVGFFTITLGAIALGI